MSRIHFTLLFVLLLLAAGVLTFVGYYYTTTPSETVLQLRQDKAELTTEKEVLRAELRQKELQVQATTRLISKILDDLSAVADRKDLLRGLEVNPPAQLAADFPESEKAVRAAESLFTRYLSLIESNLRDSQQQIDRVRNSNRVEPEQVDQMENEIATLADKMSARDSLLTRLRDTVDSLEGLVQSRSETVATLEAENETFRSKTTTLSRAFLAVGTGDDLEKRGIIDQRFLRAPRVVDLSPDRFNETSMTDAEIPLPAGADDAEILSIHREAPELYTIDDNTLHIHDPVAFWARSKFLIVLIDP